MPLQRSTMEKKKKFHQCEWTGIHKSSSPKHTRCLSCVQNNIGWAAFPVTHICKPSGKNERKKKKLHSGPSFCSKCQTGRVPAPTHAPFNKKKSGLLSLAQRPESSGFSAISFFFFFLSQKGTRILHMHINAMPPLKCIPPRPLPVFPAMLSCARPPHPWLLLSPLPALHLSRIPAEPPYLHTDTFVNLVRRALAGSCRPAAKRRSAS